MKTLIVTFVVICSLGMAEKRLMGGWTELDPKDKEVQSFAVKGVKQFNKMSNDMFDHQLVKVIEAHSQVVSGINYKIKVELGKTSCQKVGCNRALHYYNLQGKSCDNAAIQSKSNYLIKVYSQPWTGTESFSFEKDS